MAFPTTVINGWTVIEIPGEINYERTLQLKDVIEKLTKDKVKKICINLRKANFIGTSVLGIFFFAQKHMDGLGGEFCLLDPRELVREVLETVGMTKIIKVVPDESTLL